MKNFGPSFSSAIGGLPALTVVGNKLQDPSGKTIVLRGAALIDIGALYTYGGHSAAGITARIDKVVAAGVQGHANGASWTAWVTANAWTPSIFVDSALTQLTPFGMQLQTWLAAKSNSDWVQ